MISLRRTRSSRANGALSRGPRTPEGKAASSRNALRHGLTSQCIVLPNESRESFQALFHQFVDRFAPLDDIEVGMIEEMAASYWRMRRAWAVETNLLQGALQAQPPGPEVDRLASAFSGLAAQPPLGLLHRYETRLHLMFQRALHNILLLRANALQNEPSPTSEHPDALSGELEPQG